jgi:hypothetical protein
VIYAFINRLPQRWRFKAQRRWMHIRDFRDFLWNTSPVDLVLQGFIAPALIALFLKLVEWFGSAFLGLVCGWGALLIGMGIAKALTHFFRRGGQLK